MLRFIMMIFFYFLSFSSYAEKMTIESQSVENNIPMPTMYTCDGKDISPDLKWTNLPNETKSLAIIFSDEDAPSGKFYHWVVFNLPSNATGLEQGIKNLPSGAVVAKNSWGKSLYNGPCPPKGSLHHYTFTLYALNNKLSMHSNLDAQTLLKNMQGHILKQAKLKTSYARWLV